MHPFDIRTMLMSTGYWFAYYSLREEGVSRMRALWLIWIARNC